MTRGSDNPIFGGTLSALAAEALVVPTGLLAAAFLTRRLGPSDYGLLVLVGALISWVEWSITTVLARTSVKFVSEADDWRPIGGAVVRWHLLAGLGGMLGIWALAPILALLFREPALLGYLWLYALDIPLFSLAQAHRSVLVGVGAFTPRAFAAAGRWVSRLILILVLVQLGLSVPGAILANLGASVVELVIARWAIRPGWFGGYRVPPMRLFTYAAPLSLMALSLRFYDKLDLFALKALGAPASQAGFYGAAQNLAWVPGLFATAFAPLLLASLSANWSQGDQAAARNLGRQALRLSVALLPFGALAAGAGTEINTLAYGAAWRPAAIVFGPLVLGEVASVMASVTTTILIAAGEPALALALSVPLVPLALAGHLLVIPLGGPLGAALVTGSLNVADTLVTFLAVGRLLRLWPSVGTVVRSAALATLAYAAGALWPAPGLWVLLKLPVLVLGLVGAFVACGELSRDEVRWLLAWGRTRLHWPAVSGAARARSDER